MTVPHESQAVCWKISIRVWGCATRMATMECFDTILNWKLKRGSHTFPSQDGGSRIIPAAIVAAGFRYQPIQSVKSMPECFSRPIWVLCEDQELVRNERGDRVCQLTPEERWVEAGLRVGMTVSGTSRKRSC